jgi:hypothetical protein
MRRLLPWLCVCALFQRLVAEEITPGCPTGNPEDIQFDYRGRCEDGNFRTYDDHIAVRAFLEIPFYNFDFTDISSQTRSNVTDGKKIQFEPNIGTNIGFGLAYLGYGISGSLPLSTANKDTQRYGSISYPAISISSSTTPRGVGVATSFTRITGVFISKILKI